MITVLLATGLRVSEVTGLARACRKPALTCTVQEIAQGTLQSSCEPGRRSAIMSQRQGLLPVRRAFALARRRSGY